MPIEDTPSDSSKDSNKKSSFLKWFLISCAIAFFVLPIIAVIFIGATTGDWKPGIEMTVGQIFSQDHRIYELQKKVNEYNYLKENNLPTKYDNKDIMLFRTSMIQSFIILIVIFVLLTYGLYKLFYHFSKSSNKSFFLAFSLAILILGLTEFTYVLLMGKWSTGNFELIIPFQGIGILIETLLNKWVGWFPGMYNYINATNMTR